MAAWYLGGPRELLLDLDNINEMKPYRTADGVLQQGRRENVWFRWRLRIAIESGLLKVADIWKQPSQTVGRFHAYILLTEDMALNERLVWQMHLGNDLTRSKCDLMRAQRERPGPTLLIEPEPIVGFWRPPDEICLCTDKHEWPAKGEDSKCPVWNRYRESKHELFGTHGKPVRPLPDAELPEGRIAVHTILNGWPAGSPYRK